MQCSPLGFEEECKFMLVELVLRIHDLHGQAAVAHLRLAHTEDLGLLLDLSRRRSWSGEPRMLTHLVGSLVFTR